MIGLSAPSPSRRLLDEGRRTRAMRWVMAVMVFLTVLAAALGLATLGAAGRLDRELAGRLTVQLVRSDDAGVERLAAALRAMPQVRAVRVVPRAELGALLEPWLGDAGLDADLPMPAMIDVDLADPGEAAMAAVRARAAAAGGSVDAHARWLAPVRGFIVSLGWLAAALVVLMGVATGGIVLLTARSGLDTHRDTIDVLHMLGSTDHQVSRLFQRRIALDTLVGGGIGAVLGLATVAAIAARVAALGSELVGGAGLDWRDWLLLAALPLAFAALATVAARIAVLGALRRVL